MLFQNIPLVHSQIIQQATGFCEEYLRAHHIMAYNDRAPVFPSGQADRPEYSHGRSFVQGKGYFGASPGNISSYQTYQTRYAIACSINIGWMPLETTDTKRFNLNIDPTWTAHSANFGGLIRDHFGRVRFSFIIALAHLHSPEHVETVAIRKGLHLARRFGYTNHILESDYKVVIDKLLAQSRILGPLGQIHQQIFSLIDNSLLFYLLIVAILIFQRIYRPLRPFLPIPPMFGLSWFPFLSPLLFKQI